MTGSGWTHEEAHEALAGLALDALDVAERAGVLAHLASCFDCQAELRALETTAAEMSFLVPPSPMPGTQRDRVRARLMGRAAADRAAVPEHSRSSSFHLLIPHGVPADPVVPIWQQLANSKSAWVAMAASVIAIVSATMLFSVTRERDLLASRYQTASAERSTNGEVLDSLRALVADRNSMIANLTGPHVAVVTLASAGVRAPSARMFWDQSVNAWTFVAHNLRPLEAGRTYQLWLVTARQKISAGTFKPDTNGDAVVRATYALPRDALAAVAVTDEPSSGSAQPTTVPFIVGVKSGR